MRASSPEEPDMGSRSAATAAAAGEKEAPRARPSSFMSVFMHADAADVALMVLGLVGAMGDGMSLPATLLLYIRLTNDLGRGPDLVPDFTSRINEVGRYSSASLETDEEACLSLASHSIGGS